MSGAGSLDQLAFLRWLKTDPLLYLVGDQPLIGRTYERSDVTRDRAGDSEVLGQWRCRARHVVGAAGRVLDTPHEP